MAIKNVGAGPIEAIIKARAEGGPFKSLDDFCRHVDMTQINKRALESLIKVGAFDEFGPRHQLLAVIDQMVGMASQARKAAERGQFMLFDALGSTDETFIALPSNVTEIPRKELLNYEKELTGAYVSEHPLTAQMTQLREYITHTSNELSEGDHGQKVVLAGVVTMVRPHVSKTGKSMAFAELEDLYGRVELTIFPRTWEEYQDKIQRDKVVVVWGKAEVREGGTAKLLVERVNDSLTRAVSAEARPSYIVIEQGGELETPTDAAHRGYSITGDVPLAVHEERAPAYGMSPPEPEFPPDFPGADGYVTPDDSLAWASEERTVAAPAVQPDAAPQPLASAQPAPPRPDEPERKVAEVSAVSVDGVSVAATRPASRSSIETQLSNDPLLVIIRRCGDTRQDVARLEAIHKTLLEFKGGQPFSICLRNDGRKDVTVDFPNDTTRDCMELREKLRGLGAELTR
jgi:DNA polymerase-3 subunit alpha